MAEGRVEAAGLVGEVRRGPGAGRPSGPGALGPSVARAVTAGLVRRVREGTLVVAGAAGGFSGGAGAPVVRVDVHDPRTYGAVLRSGSEGLARSYLAGWWDTDDLTGLVRLLVRNLSTPIGWLDELGRWTTGPLSWWERLTPPTRSDDRTNVRAHYDLAPELFALMLDPTMSYSCAIFEKDSATLEEAQLAKLDRIVDKLGLGPEDHLVEIGSGWGGLAIHAARSTGCRVTTTTVSAEQERLARRRVMEAGLADRVTVLGRDYRDLEGTYDKLVSVEMIEAVDWRRHDEYLATCDRLLKPDGLALIQAIVIADRSYERAKHHDDYIRGIVFPGSCLPSVTAIAEGLTRATGLRIFDLEDIGRHYAPTLRAWDRNLAAHAGALRAAGLDAGFLRAWHFYLCYCEGGFLERHVSDVQLLVAGPEYRPGPGVRSR